MAYNKEETGVKTVIKLLLRCIKLYESLDQVKKVLKAITQLENSQNDNGIGGVLRLKAKLEDQENMKDATADQIKMEIEMGTGLYSPKESRPKTPVSEFVYPYTKSINESSEKQLDIPSQIHQEEPAVDQPPVGPREKKILDKAFLTF